LACASRSQDYNFCRKFNLLFVITQKALYHTCIRHRARLAHLPYPSIRFSMIRPLRCLCGTPPLSLEGEIDFTTLKCQSQPFF